MGSIVLGVDFDCTICDTSALKQEYVRRQYGFSIEAWQANRTVLTRELGILSGGEYDSMVEAVLNRENTLNAGVIDGAYE